MPYDIAPQASGLIDDVWDVATSVVDKAGDALVSAWDVIDNVPGFQQLGEGTKALFKGPLRDFANTAVGRTIIRALSTGLMGASFAIGSATPFAVPLALSGSAVAMAMPSMVRGEDFWTAYFHEGLWRAEQTLKILTANQAGRLTDEINAQVSDILNQSTAELSGAVAQIQQVVSRNFLSPLTQLYASTGNGLSKLMSPEALAQNLGIPSLSVTDLAQRFGIQDINAAILQHYLYPDRWPYFPSLLSFDPVTGKQKPGVTLAKVPVSTTASTPKTAAELKVSLDTAKRMNLPAATIASLQRQYDAAAAAEAPRNQLIDIVSSFVSRTGGKLLVATPLPSSTAPVATSSEMMPAGDVMAPMPSALEGPGLFRGLAMAVVLTTPAWVTFLVMRRK